VPLRLILQHPKTLKFPTTHLQALDKLGVSVDPTGDAVAFQAEPIAALLAIGLPGGPAQLPQEHHGALWSD
jgi:hypothetical protein